MTRSAYGCEADVGARAIIYLVFSFLYLILLIWNIYLFPFALVSDLESYSNHYNYGGVYDFGIEMIVPVLFFMANAIGLSFYDFVFVLGLLYLWPILIMAGFVKVRYLIFYFLFYFLFFVPNYAFLMRQYFSFFMFLLYASGKGKWSRLFLTLSIFSHLSALLWLVMVAVRKTKIIPYLSLISIGVYILFFFGFSLMGSFLDVIGFLNQSGVASEITRKVNGVLTHSDSASGSGKVYFAICVTILIHSYYMIRTGDAHPVLAVMYVSSCLALIFSESAVVSNRIGFAAFFFSIPYFFMVVSRVVNVSGFNFIKRRYAE